MSQFTFTQEWIDNLPPTQKRKRYYDTTKGLVLEVMTSGSKIYRYRRTVHYKDQTKAIGNVSKVTLAQARARAEKFTRQLQKGADFQEERRHKEGVPRILKELAEHYFTIHADERCVTAKEMRNSFYRWFTPDLNIKLSELTKSHIQSRISRLSSGGYRHRANRAFQLIRAILNWGIKQEFLEKNPAVGIEMYAVHSRMRFIEPHEFVSLFKAIEAYADERIRDYIYLSLYTGARQSNVLAMRWEQLNLDLGIWQIPRSKNGESYTVGLSDRAREILEIREKVMQTKPSPWVFPAGGKGGLGKSGHLRSPGKGWRSILKKAGIHNLRLHDLRRTVASYAVMGGESIAVVMRMLGHKSLDAAKIYQHADWQAIRRASNNSWKMMQELAFESEQKRRRLMLCDSSKTLLSSWHQKVDSLKS